MKSVEPKPKAHVQYKLGNEWFKGKNLSSQLKRKSANNNWVNTHIDGDKTATSIDWTIISSWEKVELNESNVYLSSAEEQCKRLQMLEKNNLTA